MAGYTDAAFRLLCKEYGAELTITELISAESIVRNNEHGFRIAFVSEQERRLSPTGIQLFGSNPKKIAQAADMLEKNVDFIDLNFGCPAPKITKSMGGAALLAKPELIKEILESVVTTIRKPVTAKMRLGIKDVNDAVKIAKIIENAGVTALFVHARTLKQGYSGESDWMKIAEIKNALSIPVFGNGNVRSYKDAIRMFDGTKCDGILIGRAALGNPSIFEACKKKNDFEATVGMRKNAFARYLELRKGLGLRESLGDIKAHALQFIKGIPKSTETKTRIACAKEEIEIISCFAMLTG